jgi:hypothetical protein
MRIAPMITTLGTIPMMSYAAIRAKQTIIATIHSTHHCAELGYHMSTDSTAWLRKQEIWKLPILSLLSP